MPFDTDPNVKPLPIRVFGTGATRDQSDSKIDYDGFLSPYALRAYGEYMHSHRQQPDGTLRDSDNWQKGIPMKEYVKSKWRHFMDIWTEMRREEPDLYLVREQLCADFFNTQGLLHEVCKAIEEAEAPGEEKPVVQEVGTRAV